MERIKDCDILLVCHIFPGYSHRDVLNLPIYEFITILKEAQYTQYENDVVRYKIDGGRQKVRDVRHKRSVMDAAPDLSEEEHAELDRIDAELQERFLRDRDQCLTKKQ